MHRFSRGHYYRRYGYTCFVTFHARTWTPSPATINRFVSFRCADFSPISSHYAHHLVTSQGQIFWPPPLFPLLDHTPLRRGPPKKGGGADLSFDLRWAYRDPLTYEERSGTSLVTCIPHRWRTA